MTPQPSDLLSALRAPACCAFQPTPRVELAPRSLLPTSITRVGGWQRDPGPAPPRAWASGLPPAGGVAAAARGLRARGATEGGGSHSSGLGTRPGWVDRGLRACGGRARLSGVAPPPAAVPGDSLGDAGAFLPLPLAAPAPPSPPFPPPTSPQRSCRRQQRRHVGPRRVPPSCRQHPHSAQAWRSRRFGSRRGPGPGAVPAER